MDLKKGEKKLKSKTRPLLGEDDGENSKVFEYYLLTRALTDVDRSIRGLRVQSIKLILFPISWAL